MWHRTLRFAMTMTLFVGSMKLRARPSMGGKCRNCNLIFTIALSIQTNQKSKEVRDRSAEDEKVEDKVIISFESAD